MRIFVSTLAALCVILPAAGRAMDARPHLLLVFTDDQTRSFDRYQGHTALTADATGWRLEK